MRWLMYPSDLKAMQAEMAKLKAELRFEMCLGIGGKSNSNPHIHLTAQCVNGAMRFLFRMLVVVYRGID